VAVSAPTVTAALVGATSGIGGGVIRDVLPREVPLVLHREIYALPAVLGSTLIACGHRLGWPLPPTLAVAAVLVAGIHLVALWRHWQAPRPRRPRN
jgi:uncharacterized membrane protein YeiH